MAPITLVPTTTLPTPPSKADPTNFAARGDAFLGALPVFQTETNTAITELNKIVSGLDQAEPTTAYAAGTTYGFPDVCAGSDGYTYRCISTGVIGDNPVGSITGDWLRLSPVFATSGETITGTSTDTVVTPAGAKAALDLKLDIANLLGTVSETAGVPDGDIFEYGSTATGEYTKFASGLMICTHTITTSGAFSVWSPLYVSTPKEWVYPEPFVAVPAVSGMPYLGAGTAYSWVVPGGSGVGPSSGFFSVMKNSATAATISYKLTAIGRWF